MIKLLVVDDSPLMRRLLSEVFLAEGDFAVSFARDGLEALSALRREAPDVITLDLQMPHMDGLTCLDRIMVERPTPVVVASSLTASGSEAALQALALGAVDVVAKPSGAVSLKMETFGPLLVDKVRAAARARLPAARRLRDRLKARSRPPAASVGAKPARTAKRPGSASGMGVVLIGCSTGGPPALDAVLTRLPAAFPWPVVIAQHMPAGFTGPLARRLDGLAELSVCEVTTPQVLRPGFVYVGHGDADMLISLRKAGPTVMSAPAHPDYRWHPSVSRLVDSAMEHLRAEQLVGVLMTGMGADGADAMTRLRGAGGRTIAQSEETSVVWGMPGELVRRGGADQVEDLEEIGPALTRLVAA